MRPAAVCLLAASALAATTGEVAVSNATMSFDDIVKGIADYWADVEATAKPGPTVQLPDGAVQGVTDKKVGVDIFWSMPFAQPPVGDLRFAPPVENERWNGTRLHRGPPRWCPQLHVLGLHFGEEDCLYLNVFRPQGASPDAKLPVMVWIYGGAFVFGDGWELGWYDGRHLAQTQNVIVVTLNYRVNNLGFLALQSLFEAHGTTGNWGLLDQQMALKWVQRNIGALGGDAGRVTIFGQSAGGCSVVGQLSMPSSRGLFHAAISQSPLAGTDIAWMPMKNATTFGSLFANLIGCGQEGAAQLACLRAKPLKEVLNAADLQRKKFPGAPDGALPLLMPLMPWWPTVDGTTLPDSPHALALKGEIADVPIMLGTVNNEGSIFVPAIGLIVGHGATYPLSKKHLRIAYDHFFPPNVSDAVEKQYPLSSAGGPLDPLRPTRLASRVLMDYLFTCDGRRLLRNINSAAAKRKSAVYQYHFEYPVKGILGTLGGDYHTSELSYVFDNRWFAHRFFVGFWGRRDKLLAAEMGSYWASFARGSNTAAPLNTVNCTASDKSDCIAWPPNTATANGAGDSYMIWDDKLKIGQGLEQSNCDFWDSVGYEGVHP
eukprot:TRINITY_DN146_c0_g4_i1.p1 TRINITY_DN146_c0_g4~~TRINITY_DN146_c0_g4_i1.p1  ORF type:complete len:628 (+),score=233.97 TRINITY_DN146_c0_g4_i1:84-1886(+)